MINDLNAEEILTMKSTIMEIRGEIVDSGILPFEVILWNIFPFHPYDTTVNELKNRTPNDDELEIGINYALKLITLCPQAKVITIGKKSYHIKQTKIKKKYYIQTNVIIFKGQYMRSTRKWDLGFLSPYIRNVLKLNCWKGEYLLNLKRYLQIWYKDTLLEQYYKADLICYGTIIVELKAISGLEDIHRVQVLNYLRATELRLGLLVNFGSYPKVTIERIVL